MSKTKHLAGWGRTTFWLMAAVCLLLFVTGMVMFVLPASELMEMSPAQASLRHSVGVVHGVFTWLFCILCGRGVWPHVRVMWHKQGESVKWVLGLMNVCMFVALGLTGLSLLYGSPDLHDVASPWHVWIGALCPFVPSKFEPHQ